MEEQRARQEGEATKPAETVSTATSAPHVEGNFLQGALHLPLRNTSRRNEARSATLSAALQCNVIL